MTDLSWIDGAIGAGAVLAGLALGGLAPLRKSKSPAPYCTCDHGYGHHDENGCHYTESESVLVERGQPRNLLVNGDYDTYRIVYDHERWETVETACGCKKYTGPEPLFDFLS